MADVYSNGDGTYVVLCHSVDCSIPGTGTFDTPDYLVLAENVDEATANESANMHENWHWDRENYPDDETE